MYFISNQVGPDGGIPGKVRGPLGACCASCAKKPLAGALGELSGSSLVTGGLVLVGILWGYSKLTKAMGR